ncbi:acyl carrier protein [Actinomycetaceae bacterium MB13-C1-2]|nr:acyl carrier protein [Actinomycetaceae bacterium MB13-C1-2]
MSIGDLFGDDLKALLGDSAESGSKEVSTESAETSAEERSGLEGASEDMGSDGPIAFVSGGESAVQTVSNIESVVRSILAELSSVEPAAISLDTELGEYGAEGLGLWAVVAEVERHTGQAIKDEDVADWKTPSDIMDSVQDI